MSYGLKPRRSVGREVMRIADKQVGLAIERLRHVGNRRADSEVHEARRHVKKVRALLRLVKPALGDRYYLANRRMRLANRMLAPIADGEGVLDSMTALHRSRGPRLGDRTAAAIRAALIERAARTRRRATLDRTVAKVARILRDERQRLGEWALNARGFRAVEPGLEHSYRRARNAMRRAALEPNADHYHTWRRRVKDLWFQVRLLEPRCGNVLIGGQRDLEALDGLLGEYHNVVLLEEALVGEGLLSRRQTARALRVLRRSQAELRHRALSMAGRIFSVKPRRFVRGVEDLWRSTKIIERATEEGTPWPRAA
jgi:CHAD domain-containing protein